MARTFYQRTGYDVFITIGGALIPRTWITGFIKIVKAENQATIATFSLLNPAGLQTPEYFQGLPVAIDIRTAEGVFRSFTGIIDMPELDLINQVTTYICTDNRENKIKLLSTGFINSIGIHSETVFGIPKDAPESLQKRLSTVPASMDFDNYGNPVYTPWAPKATADFTLGPSQVYYIEPKVSYTSRIKTTNTVSINLDYTYQRLHQRVLYYSWGGIDFCTWYLTKHTFPTKDMIAGAAKGSGWSVLDLSLGNIWPEQTFRCAGVGMIGWQPNTIEREFRNKVDSNGNVVTDAAGNTLQEVSRVTVNDASSHLCIGAAWWARLRFGQNIIERYEIKMTAPQSVAKYGTVEDNEEYSLVCEFDDKAWEKSQDNPTSKVNLYINKDINRSALNQAFQTILNKARTTLLASHRDVTVYFKTPIWPQVDLKHTVQVNTTPLACRGKVSRIEHEINVATTEAKTSVELSLSRMIGSSTNSALFNPSRPTENTGYIGTVQTITMGTHLGVSPSSAGYEELSGYFANREMPRYNNAAPYRTDYPEGFVMDTPPIPDMVRANRELWGAGNYTTSVPNDYLEVRY